ncbi:MAG: VanW family protein [Oscillospiraceae bacterium]|nr:VanW family protein [Oscillospiraceae bacterium]
MKRFFAAVLAAVCLLGAMPFASASFAAVREPIEFSDVQASDWFISDVQFAYALGLMSGTGENLFSPNGVLTAAEAVAVASRIHSIYAEDGAEFIQGEPWYQVYWDYALAQSVIADGLLEPAQPITREQFAYVLCGALPSSELPQINEIADDALPDVVTQTTYGGFVYRLYRAGVLTGNNVYGTFHPQSTLRRSEAAAMIVRLVDPAQRVAFTLAPCPDPDEIVLAGKTEVKPGDQIRWTAKLLPEEAVSEISWAAGNPGVATVDENGVITAHKPGDCHITATAANGVKKTGLLHVLTAEALFLKENKAEVLASYDSPHTAIAPRTNNLILACNAINGTVLEPGEVFSFNKIVGERTAEKGYKEATVYAEGGVSEPALGGGVCQVASTIYLCALNADLEIVERTEHMYAVTYVPLGMDATIYWGSLDFKFRNSTSHPLLIRASVSGGKVHVQLLGTKESQNTVKMRYTVLTTTPWQTVEQKDNTKEAGYRSVSVTPYTGYTVQTYKDRYDASGKLISSEKCAFSTYRKRDQVVIVGPEKKTEPVKKPIRIGGR